MKPGYGSKGKKKTKRKQQKKAGDDGDVNMRTADSSHTYQQAPADPSSKGRLVERLEQKKALKAKVASLKSSRSKLTKLPTGNARRREYSQLIKRTVEEFTGTVKAKASADAAADAAPASAAADAGDSMVE